MEKHRAGSGVRRPANRNPLKLIERTSAIVKERRNRRSIYLNKWKIYNTRGGYATFFSTDGGQVDELQRECRSSRQGEISAFSDGGNWKVEDISVHDLLAVVNEDLAVEGGHSPSVNRISDMELNNSSSKVLNKMKEFNDLKYLLENNGEYVGSTSSESRSIGDHDNRAVENNEGVSPLIENHGDPAEFHQLSGKRYLLILHYPSRIYFRGTLSVTPVIGRTAFLGFEFTPGMTSQLVFSPKGISPLYLRAAGHLNEGDFEKMPFIPGFDKKILKRLGMQDSAILLEPATGEYWERLFGLFSNTLNFNPLIPNAKEGTYSHSELNVEKDLGVNFVHRRDCRSPSRLHDENPVWDHLSEAVLNAEVDKGPVRLMIFGGKGVGKSTFMRFIVNRWLSISMRRKRPKLSSAKDEVALFIDLDPGQSEFVPPGCISATLISQPLLGPNYTHLKDPERMICIGDFNVESCANWYLQCAYELLKFCSSTSALSKLPWFINTMGFCRGVGGDLAVRLIQLVQPTHVIQLKSRFSRRNFNPLDLLSWNSVRFWSGTDWNPSISGHKGAQLPEYFYYQMWSLAERPNTEEEPLENSEAAEVGANTSSVDDTGEIKDIDSEWGLPAWQSRALCTLAYFSRIVSAPRYSMLKPTPHTMKLSDIILSLPSPLLKPSMITTAFNARLVVLCNYKGAQETSATSQSDIYEGQSSQSPSGCDTEEKKQPWERVLRPNTMQHPKVLFHMPLRPCVGFGIVRAINETDHCLYLTTPVRNEVLGSVDCLLTSPSIGCIPEEIYFEPLKLDSTLNRESIPYVMISDKKNPFSRTVPRVFHLPSKCLPKSKI